MTHAKTSEGVWRSEVSSLRWETEKPESFTGRILQNGVDSEEGLVWVSKVICGCNNVPSLQYLRL